MQGDLHLEFWIFGIINRGTVHVTEPEISILDFLAGVLRTLIWLSEKLCFLTIIKVKYFTPTLCRLPSQCFPERIFPLESLTQCRIDITSGTSQVVPWWRIHLLMQGLKETQVWSLGQEDLLKKEMATHSSILAWEIPWTEEPSRLRSRRS